MEGLDTFPAFPATFAFPDDAEADYDAVGTAEDDEGKAAIAEKLSSRCGTAPGLMAGWDWRPAGVAFFPAAAIGAGSGTVQEALADAG